MHGLEVVKVSVRGRACCCVWGTNNGSHPGLEAHLVVAFIVLDGRQFAVSRVLELDGLVFFCRHLGDRILCTAAFEASFERFCEVEAMKRLKN